MAKTSMYVGPVTEAGPPAVAYLLRPGTYHMNISSAEGSLAEGVPGTTQYFLQQPAFGYIVRVPRTQHMVVLRVNTKRLSEQEQIEKANDSIERFGRIFFF